ncbi:PD40 domain-containing protein [Algoriphagus sp. AK58]|uniref:TolB family protein n=1 Tax=Algoriphagus sp. AK58 TaxID=1406877 RepID=UPI00164F6156|nr:PD40 domain-containing protein [Algoriphagus sp. AK58]MBC6367187.1 hypothetical protein [Algoriphagus sp. AK58]
MRIHILLFMLIATGILSSCWVKYPNGEFPKSPQALPAVNSEFDDYNSDLRIIFHEMFITFSSNRESRGREFDLYTPLFVFSWDQEEGVFGVSEIKDGNYMDAKMTKEWFSSTKTEFDELGPYSFDTGQKEAGLFFSRNTNGKFSIHYKNHWTGTASLEGENPIRLLDGNSNEMYPSFLDPNYLRKDWDRVLNPEKLIFTSDKDGRFDLYEVDLPTKNVVSFLTQKELKQAKKISISSSSNDHASFVYGNVLVFASDRAGGLGGYDLYYSVYSNGNWSTPQNFGPTINSPQDEFRPILSDHPQFKNRLMIFSSNRPGGMGGFDLYYVGIPKF